MADYNNDKYLWEHGMIKGINSPGTPGEGMSLDDALAQIKEEKEEKEQKTDTSISTPRLIDEDDPDTKDPYPDEVNPKDLLGVKKAPLHLVPPALRLLAAPAMAIGAERYGPYNWREKPVKLSVYLSALQRHIDALWDGEDYAEDSGVRHDAHAAACLAIIADARGVGNLIDDRPAKGPAPRLLKEQDGTDTGAKENAQGVG